MVFFSINSDLLFPVSPFHTHLSTSTLTGFVPLYHCFPDKREKMHKNTGQGKLKKPTKIKLKGSNLYTKVYSWLPT